MDDSTKHICEAFLSLIFSLLLLSTRKVSCRDTHYDDIDQCAALLHSYFADSNPFNDSSTEQILGVVVDMSNPANASVHPGDKYALEGDEVVVIRSRISELSQSLDVLASNGRVIDTRIVAFALGSELG